MFFRVTFKKLVNFLLLPFLFLSLFSVKNAEALILSASRRISGPSLFPCLSHCRSFSNIPSISFLSIERNEKKINKSNNNEIFKNKNSFLRNKRISLLNSFYSFSSFFLYLFETYIFKELANQQTKSTLQLFKNQIVLKVYELEKIIGHLINDILGILLCLLRNLLGIYAIIASFMAPYYLQFIENFNHVCINDPLLLAKYGLPNNANPKTFGADFIDIIIESSDNENIKLSGWYIPPFNINSSVSSFLGSLFSRDNSQKQGILCVHGCLTNRQACLPFLQLAIDLGIMKKSHMLLFDMRNSGNSSRARTDLDVKAAADIYDAVCFMKANMGLEKLCIYAQSTGCMAVMMFLDMYKNELKEINVTVDKIIMESPLCNIKHILYMLPASALMFNMFNWLFKFLIWLLELRYGGQLDRMRASVLLNSIKFKNILIFQHLNDGLTPTKNLIEEFSHKSVNDAPKHIYLFEKGYHGNLLKPNFNDCKNIMKSFLCSKGVFSFFYDYLLTNNVRKMKQNDFKRS